MSCRFFEDRQWLAGVLAAIGVAALDQASKIMVSENMFLHESIQICGNVFRITHARNPGIAFGFSSGLLSGWPLTMITVVGAGLICTFLLTQKELAKGRSVMVGLVLGGAIGNLIDRMARGEVVDFLDVGFGSTRWPVFNVADSAVVVGVLLYMLTNKEDDPKEQPDHEKAGEAGR